MRAQRESFGSFGWVVVACLGLGGLLAPPPAGAIDVVLVWDDLDENPSWDPNGTHLMALAQEAASRWERLIDSPGEHIVDVSWSNLDDNGLGLWKFDPFGNNNLYFDADRSNWFVDSTPDDDSEFDFGDPLDFVDDSGGSELVMTDSFSGAYFDQATPPDVLETAYFGFGTSPATQNNVDLLSVIMHEMGHELGIAGDEFSGRYAIYPQDVNGIQGLEVIEANLEGSTGYGEEHGHLAPPDALLSPLDPGGRRTLPSAVDVLAAARDSGYTDVDLVRKFSGISGDYDNALVWIGGQVPNYADDVIIVHGGTVTVDSDETADSVAVGRGSELVVEAGDLAIDRELIIGGNSRLEIPFGSAVTADSLDLRAFGDVDLVGGRLNVDGGVIGDQSKVSGRGRLESDGVLRVEGTIEASGGDLRLDGTGSFSLASNAGEPGGGVIDAHDANVGLAAGVSGVGRIAIGGGHSLTALEDVSIPFPVTVQLLGDGATIHSISNVDLRIGHLEVENQQLDEMETTVSARSVTFDGTVDVKRSGHRLVLASPLGTTFDGDMGVIGEGTLVQEGDISVRGGGTAHLTVDTFDWGNSTASEGHDIVVGPNSVLDVDVRSLASRGNGFRGGIQIDSGVLDIAGLEQGEWTLSAPFGSAPAGILSMIHSGVADPVVRGDRFNVGDFLIVSGGDAFIESDVHVESTGKVVLFGGDARLFLMGDSTFDGGTYSGLGTLVQRGDIDVTADTTITVDEFNWGNSLGLEHNTLSIGRGDTLTLDSPGTGDPDNQFRGHLRLDGGELVVNTLAPWTLPADGFLQTGGSLEMNNTGVAPRIGGQDLTIGDDVIVTGGRAVIDTNVAFLDSSHTDVAAGASLELTGSNSYRGAFTGDGTLVHQGSALLSGTPLAVPHLVTEGRLTALGIGGAEALLDTQTLRFDAGSETRLFGDLRIRGAATVEQDAEFNGSGSLIVDAGATLSGDAEIGVDVVNEGTVAPGSSPGRLDVLGDYVQTGKLEIQLGGTQAGTEYDVLSILGDATLGGLLELLLVDGFVPAPGDAFAFLEIGGARIGEFDALTLPDLGTSGFWDMSALYTEGRATFVPEPGTCALVALGLALLRARRRHP